ncbi:hypothetical protein BgiMline_018515 [Biomphalaria glabrata]|nr:hypothetical protein BgiMline_006135 [Biomphalaria glabrata]
MNITNFAKEDADAMNASRKRTVSTLILPCKIGWFGGLFGQGATGSLLGDEPVDFHKEYVVSSGGLSPFQGFHR